MKFILLHAPAAPLFLVPIRRNFSKRWNELAVIELAVSSHLPGEKTLTHPDCAGWIAPMFSKAARALAQSRRFPVVNLSNRFGPCAHAINVFLDEEEIAALAVEHLIERGYRSFAYIGFGKVPGFSRERGACFRKVLQSRGYEVREHYINPLPNPHPVEFGEAVHGEIRRLLRSWTAPTGIFAANDELAGRILRIRREDSSGHLPFHAVVGVDDRFHHGERDSYARHLTSVRPAFEALGRRAAEVLHEAMDDRSSRPPGSVVRVSGAVLIERESTCGFATGHPVVNEMARWIRAEVDEGRAPAVADLAREFQLKPRAASALFAKQASVSLREFTMGQRLTRAARLLLETDLRVGEIAQRCAFGKQGDLNDVFQRHFHRTPGEFRRHSRGDTAAMTQARPCTAAPNR
ncbi:MAG: substrate-binding domain-containing protein [Opitutales bacterium]|nr:substrate-binding domain-containing protein [Opitutales bacterium]